MEQLIDAILAMLQAAGLPAARALPDGPMPRLKGPAAAVLLRSAKTAPAGFGAYLGETEQGAQFGLRLQAQLRVRVVSPAARTGETFAERVCDVLLGAQSVSVTQISRGETAYDGTLECFLTDLDLTVSALLIAVEESDDGVFTDFILKGAIA